MTQASLHVFCKLSTSAVHVVVKHGLPPWPVITQPMRAVSLNMLVMVDASSSLSCSGEAIQHIDRFTVIQILVMNDSWCP